MGVVARSAWVTAGIVIWAAHFMAIYAFTALACARGFAQLVPSAIAGAGVVAGTLLVAIMLRGWMGRAHFEHWLSGAIALFALIAVVYESIPAWAVPTCA